MLITASEIVIALEELRIDTAGFKRWAVCAGTCEPTVTVVWMGNPYALKDLTLADKCEHDLVAYQDDFRTCEAVADALCGIEAVQDDSPRKGPWRAGDGLGWRGTNGSVAWLKGAMGNDRRFVDGILQLPSRKRPFQAPGCWWPTRAMWC